MAGNLNVPQGVECKLLFTWQGAPHALNILHFRNPSGAAITQTTANTIDAAIKTAFTNSGIIADFATGYALANVSTRSMVAATDPWFIGTGAAVAAAGAGNPLPAATSFVVTLRTGQRGRSFQGRVYLAGWSEDANDAAGGITLLAANHALAFIDGIRVGMATSTPAFTLALLSRWTTPLGSPPNTPPTERNPPLLTDVTAIVNMDQRWDTQRRRAVPGV